MSNNLTGAERDELRRLYEKAKVPTLFVQKPRTDMLSHCKTWEVDTGGDPRWWALCQDADRAEFTAAA